MSNFIESQSDRLNTEAGNLPGADLDWLQRARTTAMQEFVASGLPTQRVEAWKYTSLNQLAKAQYKRAPIIADVTDLQLPEQAEDSYRLIFINGVLQTSLSDQEKLDGLQILSLDQALLDGKVSADHLDLNSHADALTHLNMALMDSGVAIIVEAGKEIDRPIEIVALHVEAGGGDLHYRNIIQVADGAKADLIERHIGSGTADYFINTVSQISVANGSRLRHFKHQDECADAMSLATTQVVLAEDAMYDNFAFTTGAGLSRNEIHVTLNGKGGHCRLNGAYMIAGKQHCDTTTVITHAAPETSSEEVYKGVIDGTAQGVFAGRITVEKNAQKITGNQLSRALLLSDKAQVNTKPELEIFADDVQCSHGATAGELEEDALFYLRARGIPETSARQMLIAAFVAEIIDNIDMPAARNLASKLIEASDIIRFEGDAP